MKTVIVILANLFFVFFWAHGKSIKRSSENGGQCEYFQEFLSTMGCLCLKPDEDDLESEERDNKKGVKFTNYGNFNINFITLLAPKNQIISLKVF